MSNLILPNREQRRAMDKEIDRDLPREERIKKAKERAKKISVTRMQGYAKKDWVNSIKKYAPKWATWVSKHVPPVMWILKAKLLLNACPLTVAGGMLHWSLFRMQHAKRVPIIIKRIFAVTVVLLSFIVNTIACLLCVLRFPIRWIILDPIIRFQYFMAKFGITFRIYEEEMTRMAKLEIRKFWKPVETFWYKL